MRFFNYIQFYFHTCGLLFIHSILSYLLLLNCDYFHYVNSQKEVRRVERIDWDNYKPVKELEGTRNLRNYNEYGLMSEKVPEEKLTKQGEVTDTGNWGAW